ncbi:MAG: hypothetical protein D4R93_05350 [Deltaproteobacteria bacterium]|nr:MAG: hypothetical protein D4R93_05350 [Deltaproteobacteria bacterium]
MKKLLVLLLSLGLILTFIMTASAADVSYYFGKAAAFDSGANESDYVALGAYIKANMDLGSAYVGISALYSSGDEGSDKNKAKAALQGRNFYSGLILGNHALQIWEASGGNGGAKGVNPFNGDKAGLVRYSVFGGFNVAPKLNVKAMLVTATSNKGSSKYFSKSMGTEFDITAKYQIYDNLSYMVGAGYLWPGDYFKGDNTAGVIGGDYILMNRLSLSF